MTEHEKECVEAALKVAEDALMETDHGPSLDTRIVKTADILHIIQELNASLE